MVLNKITLALGLEMCIQLAVTTLLCMFFFLRTCLGIYHTPRLQLLAMQVLKNNNNTVVQAIDLLDGNLHRRSRIINFGFTHIHQCVTVLALHTL